MTRLSARLSTCRRIPLLGYFGEHHAGGCGTCDNCTEEKPPPEDLTVAAQKFLSCVKRTGERFGMNHVIDVLRGSKGQRVLDFGHDRLSTYAIGRDLSKRQWQSLGWQCLHQGLLAQDMEFGGLHLTRKAWAVFRGEAHVFGRLNVPEPPPRAASEKQREISDYDRDLFELLREKRLELAREQDVPPFVIFADRSLVEMASVYPRTREHLLGIHGVGKVKCDTYGELFIKIITKYCLAHGISEPRPVKTQAKPEKKTTTGPRRYQEVGARYNDGQSIADIMRQYRVKFGTVLGHLVEYHADGHALRPDGLREACSLSGDQVNAVLSQFDSRGTEFLKPVFEELNGTVEYEELRLLRLYYLNRLG